MTSRTAWGVGLRTRALDGLATLDTWYPTLAFGTPPAATSTGSDLAAATGADQRLGVTRDVHTQTIDLDAPPQSVEDAYLRLHLLSHRLVAPHGLNLAGLFDVLTTVVWTSHGPSPVRGFDQRKVALRAEGVYVTVHAIDKIPRMADYVIPSGVRIADADRVRLGAHLAPGTTVMHEGFINFNAGTLGASMVEGRISAGVVVGDGSDVGGGASIMGTLSGGGKQVISIGKGTLLGANSGIGISLGDNCLVEAGLYVTAGTKVAFQDGDRTRVVKAVDLSGHDNILYRRNSSTGQVEALVRARADIALNAALHRN